MEIYTLKTLLICISLVLFVSSSEANTLTPSADINVVSSSKTKKKAQLENFLHSKIGKWYLKKLERKINRKQFKLEKRKNHWIEKGKTDKVAKIQKIQNDLATYGIVCIVGGLFCIVLGLVLLVLSLNVGLYVSFLAIGGLGLVAGLVLLLLGIMS